MTLDAFFRLGVVVDLGSYKFEPEAIKAFAPQIRSAALPCR